jgi:ATP-dependent DNA helicase RecG
VSAPTGPATYADLHRVPVAAWKGVGPKQALAFGQVGVENLLQLVTHYPRRMVDRTNERPIRELRLGEQAQVLGTIRSVRAVPGPKRRSRVEAVLADATGKLHLTFFNQPWRERQLRTGSFVAAFGKVDEFRGAIQMTNPQVDVLGDPDDRPLPIVPVYPQSEKVQLSSWQIRNAVAGVLDRIDERGLIDPLPEPMRRRYGLVDRQRALRSIHLPETMGARELARRRLAFDELLRVQVVLVSRKRAYEREARGFVHHVGGPLVRRFHERLPYALTGAQQRAIAEIDHDLAAPHPMHRLLQGDVGSGKTVVAVSALLAAVQGGHQGALMAPTEVLAEQHAAGVQALLGDLTVPDAGGSLFDERPLRTALLTNRVTGSERRAVLAGLAEGTIDLVVGTHALIQEAVAFHSLGVVVVDEQHRFGVEQRAALRAKAPGALVPDVLVMTATPIPRTAAMTVYGDLDVSVLDEKPPGRREIVTHAAQGPLAEVEVWAHVRAEVADGRQAYVVCPLVEESEKLEVASAAETFERLRLSELEGLRLGLLHGRVPGVEKDAVMDAFRRGELDVLVATTVIEVGVDVPNATVMVILDADRFGIAQLHQLRGRVGRGSEQSTCWLVTGGDEVSPRVQALVASTDGFELAEVDLELRGEGTLMSTAQKGQSDLKLASLRRDRELVELARQAAVELVDGEGVPELLATEIGLFLTDEDEEFLFKS